MFIKKKSEIGFEGKNTLETKDILKSLIGITDINSDIDKDLRKTALKYLEKSLKWRIKIYKNLLQNGTLMIGSNSTFR